MLSSFSLFLASRPLKIISTRLKSNAAETSISTGFKVVPPCYIVLIPSGDKNFLFNYLENKK